MTESSILGEIRTIFSAAQDSDDGERCMISMSPELKDSVKAELSKLAEAKGLPGGAQLRLMEPRHPGFNDGMIMPPDEYPLGTSPSVIRSGAADKAPPRGVVRVIVVLVDFTDKHMARPVQEYRDLFFSTGVLANRSVREYFAEVTNGLVDIQGEVVGPFRMPRTLAAYANGASGTGGSSPNARTMAQDAATAANATVNYGPYDNDGDGFVDAFIVIHAGRGAEETGSSNDIWSHKWVLPGSGLNVDGTRIFAYLTVPEDCKLGVCAHELGHLLFGFPDLYDTDNTSEGIGNWCLMASGSWGLGGDRPTHPSAWCKVNQGWVTVENRTTNGPATILDVKSSHNVLRLWKDGGAGQEYFLVENRQQTSFDASLPAGGLLIWHIDESQTTNSNENRYKVALMQADGQKHLENNGNRGDPGDCYPGASGNTSFNKTSTPNSLSYAGTDTCVGVTGISASGATMTANISVKCGVTKRFLPKEAKNEKIERKEFKEFKIESKEFKEIEKRILDEKRVEKPITDKLVGREKPFDFGLPGDFGRPGGFGRAGGRGGGRHRHGRGGADQQELLDRIAQLEAVVGQLVGGMGEEGGEESGRAPFIGQELRPDLSTGALGEEDDLEGLRQQMKSGAADAKRLYDGASGR